VGADWKKGWDDDAARALSDKYERVAWPPRIGARVHYNSGWPQTSWTGEIRAIVDDEVVVFFSKLPAYAERGSYKLESKIGFGVYSRGGALRYGSLPRPLCRPLDVD